MKIINESFASGNSFLHRTDSRLKLIIMLLFALITSSASNLLILIQIFLFALFLLCTAKLEYKQVIKRIIIINFFTAGVWIFVPFSYGGEKIWSLGPLTASLEGIYYALTISLRANSIMFAIIALLSTSKIINLLQALNFFRIPKKLIYLAYFIYRYIFVLKNELIKLLRAAKARGLQNKSTINTYKAYCYLISLLLINSYERSERVYQAMLARGFNNKIYIKNDFELSSTDIIFFTASLTVLIYLMVFNFGVLK